MTDTPRIHVPAANSDEEAAGKTVEAIKNLLADLIERRVPVARILEDNSAPMPLDDIYGDAAPAKKPIIRFSEKQLEVYNKKNIVVTAHRAAKGRDSKDGMLITLSATRPKGSTINPREYFREFNALAGIIHKPGSITESKLVLGTPLPSNAEHTDEAALYSDFKITHAENEALARRVAEIRTKLEDLPRGFRLDERGGGHSVG